MKNKTLALPGTIFLAGIILTIIVNLIFCTAQKPTVTEHSFPISITYEFGGETVTIRDEFVCTYTGAGRSVDPKDRFYDGVLLQSDYEETLCGDYLIASYEDGHLVIFTNLYAGYMMGDPLYDRHYTDYYRCEPYVAFYNDSDYTEYEDEETLAPYDVKIVDWEYPEPIENKLVFSGFTRLTRNNVLPMVIVSLLTLLACVILVKKDSEFTATALDKISVILNFVIGFVALPFTTIVGMFIDINGDASDPFSIATFFVPVLTGFGLAASVCLRRKGYKKASIAVQFIGIALLAVLMTLEGILW